MGGSSKASPPPPAPDPRIAEEKSRREGIAIGQLERQRRARAGTRSTILGGATSGTTLTRPTDPISTIDPASTSAAKKQAEIEALKAGTAELPDIAAEERDGRERRFGSATLGRKQTMQADITRLKGEISPAELQVFKEAKKQRNLAQYISRTRSRLGVAATKGR